MIDFGYSVTPDFDLTSGDLTMTTATHHGKTVEVLMVEIVRLKEKCIRNALIQLGWTPPPEPKGLS